MDNINVNKTRASLEENNLHPHEKSLDTPNQSTVKHRKNLSVQKKCLKHNLPIIGLDQ